MPKIESEKIDCLHRPCSRSAPQGKIKSVRTHSEVIEQCDSFSLLKLLFLVRNWHCWSRKAFTRQMTPQIREETAKTAVFRHRWQAWKVVRSIAAVRQRPRTPRNWRCSFTFFESFLWHFNKKQHAEVNFRLSRPVLRKNQENGSGKQWSLHAPLKAACYRHRQMAEGSWSEPANICSVHWLPQGLWQGVAQRPSVQARTGQSGLSNIALQWIAENLTDRSLSVRICNLTSDKYPLSRHTRIPFGVCLRFSVHKWPSKLH